jgi:biopolymer transport protein ExbD
MSKFKKDGRGAPPGVNTSSLPDIVFMLLFFFMVATTSKEVDPTVKIDYAFGQKTRDLTPYKQRSEIDFIFLGKSRNKSRDTDGYFLSLDNVQESPRADGLYEVNVVGAWKKSKYEGNPKRKGKPTNTIITCLKADEGTPYNYIYDIRRALQEGTFYKIAYAVKAKD